MTLDEANECMAKGLDVYISPAAENQFGANPFKITMILKYKHKYEKRFDYSVALSRNGRSSCTFGLNEVSPAPAWQSVIDEFVAQRKTKAVKRLIKERLSAGENKTKMLKDVGKLIDTVKEEMKWNG